MGIALEMVPEEMAGGVHSRMLALEANEEDAMASTIKVLIKHINTQIDGHADIFAFADARHDVKGKGVVQVDEEDVAFGAELWRNSIREGKFEEIPILKLDGTKLVVAPCYCT